MFCFCFCSPPQLLQTPCSQRQSFVSPPRKLELSGLRCPQCRVDEASFLFPVPPRCHRARPENRPTPAARGSTRAHLPGRRNTRGRSRAGVGAASQIGTEEGGAKTVPSFRTGLPAGLTLLQGRAGARERVYSVRRDPGRCGGWFRRPGRAGPVRPCRAWERRAGGGRGKRKGRSRDRGAWPRGSGRVPQGHPQRPLLPLGHETTDPPQQGRRPRREVRLAGRGGRRDSTRWTAPRRRPGPPL